MKPYLNLLQDVLDNGIYTENRTGINTLSVFGRQTRYHLQDGFPAVTTKKLAFKSVVSELLWFIEGSGDERRLAEILYGDDRKNLKDKTTIWTANSTAEYWLDKAAYKGDLGRIYGVQWRKWRKHNTPIIDYSLDPPECKEKVEYIDQIATIIDQIKNNPTSRRIILSAWNVSDLDQMALPPCHVMAQFNVRGNMLDCQLYQRSADAFLGVPFNIASYAILTHMIAQVTGLTAGEFIHTIGDLHIYENHIEQVKTQLKREPKELPHIWINPTVRHIDDFRMSDFKLLNYNHHGPIPADMAV